MELGFKPVVLCDDCVNLLKTSRPQKSRAWRSFVYPTALNLRIIFLWILLVADFISPVVSWNNLPVPNSQVVLQSQEPGVQIYEGQANISDLFRVILIERDYFIVGARNVAYNLSLNTLEESMKYRISWKPQTSDKDVCLSKKKLLHDCQNYIRVLLRKHDGSIFVCGTNAFNPECRTYMEDETSLTAGHTEMGTGRCPYDPTHNTTFTYTDGRMFSGTSVDFIGQNFLIFRDKSDLITVPKDSTVLNQPNFVKSFSYQDKVYFFFREIGIEHTNCGKTIFSRVARVCKNDQGGKVILTDSFTSYFKSRLNCSIPGEYPFYFDEIQSVSDLGQGNYMSTYNSGNRSHMVYAVFNTPQNSITGSAICAFRMSDIADTFKGNFKGQKSRMHNWLTVPETETPTPHPHSCAEDSTALPIKHLNFVKNHPLMDNAVPSTGGAPVFLITGVNYRFTTVAVDWQVLAADNRYYDVIFVGTDNGRVLKALNKGWDSGIEYNLIEDILVFPDNRPITHLHVHRQMEVGIEKLIVVSNDDVMSVPLHRCHSRTSCTGCVALQDPYCSWTDDKKCANTNMGIQAIRFREHTLCKDEETTHTTLKPTTLQKLLCPKCKCPDRVRSQSPATRAPVIKTGKLNSTDPRGPTHPDNQGQFTVETLAISLVMSIVLSVVVGFLLGYRVSICRHPPQPQREATFLEKADLHKTCNKFDTDSSNQLNYSDSYQPKQINVVLNVKGAKHPETKPVHPSNKVYL